MDLKADKSLMTESKKLEVMVNSSQVIEIELINLRTNFSLTC